jgi:hypothetical protein
MYLSMTIPLAARSKVCVWVAGLNTAGSVDVSYQCCVFFSQRNLRRGCLLSVLCVLQSEVTKTDRLLARRSRTECGVYECDF